MNSLIENLVQTCTLHVNDWDNIVETKNGGFVLSFNEEFIYILFGEENEYLQIFNDDNKLVQHIIYYPNKSIQNRKKFFPSGQILSDESFDFEGRRNGIFFECYPNGTLSGYSNFKRGNLHGKCILYYSSGKVKLEWNNNFGMLQGEAKKYDEFGNIEFTENFVNNKLHGDSCNYYPNGKLKQERYYYFGKLMCKKLYYPNGNLKETVSFQNNKYEGNRVEYWGDCTIKEICYYQNGLREGKWRYFEDNILLEECTYSKGVENGAFTVCDSEGNPVRKGMYKDGKIVDDIKL